MKTLQSILTVLAAVPYLSAQTPAPLPAPAAGAPAATPLPAPTPTATPAPVPAPEPVVPGLPTPLPAPVPPRPALTPVPPTPPTGAPAPRVRAGGGTVSVSGGAVNEPVPPPVMRMYGGAPGGGGEVHIHEGRMELKTAPVGAGAGAPPGGMPVQSGYDRPGGGPPQAVPLEFRSYPEPAMAAPRGEQIVRDIKMRVLQKHYESALSDAVGAEMAQLTAPESEKEALAAKAKVLRSFADKLENDLRQIATAPGPAVAGMMMNEPQFDYREAKRFGGGGAVEVKPAPAGAGGAGVFKARTKSSKPAPAGAPAFVRPAFAAPTPTPAPTPEAGEGSGSREAIPAPELPTPTEEAVPPLRGEGTTPPALPAPAPQPTEAARGR